MAIFHLNAKVISRGKGQSAIASAAYRSGERLRDEQANEQKYYTSRAERIVFTDIMAPKDAPEWAHDRNHLWNEAERAEKRKDAQLAREIEVSLPHELTEQQREWLVKDFAREAFVRRGYVVDIVIHAPDKDSDVRNHHAHLMVTMRTLSPNGFADKKDRDLNKREQLGEWREQWADLANRHLERHGHLERIDHRSFVARGIEQEPTIHLGYAADQIAARGGLSDRMAQLQGVIARNDIRVEMKAIDREIEELETARKAERAALIPGEGLEWTDKGGMVAQQRSATHAAQQLDKRTTGEIYRPSVDRGGVWVIDERTGRVVPLQAYMREELDRTPAPEPRKVAGVAALLDPAARKQAQLDRLADRDAGKRADKALERLAEDMQQGRNLRGTDIADLRRAQQEAIRSHGADAVRTMAREASASRDSRFSGRERERD